MSSPITLDAEAEGRRIASADQPVDVWIEACAPADPEIAGDQPPPTTDGGRRLRPQSTSATDPVGLPVALDEPPLGPITIPLGVDGPSTPDARPPGINTVINADEPPHGPPGSPEAVIRGK